MFQRSYVWLTAVALATGMWLFAMPANAQPGPPHGPQMGPGMGLRGGPGAGGPGEGGPRRHHMRAGRPGMPGYFLGLRDELGLTEDQVNKLETLKSETEKRTVQTRADLRVAQIELRDLLRQDDVAMNDVNPQIDKIASLRAEMLRTLVESRLNAREVLTAEQREKLDALKHSHRPRRDRRESPRDGDE